MGAGAPTPDRATVAGAEDGVATASSMRRHPRGLTPLHAAVEDGDVEACARLATRWVGTRTQTSLWLDPQVPRNDVAAAAPRHAPECPLWRLASTTHHLAATPLAFALENPEWDVAIVAALLDGGADAGAPARWAGPPQPFATDGAFPGATATVPHTHVVPVALLRACWGGGAAACDWAAVGATRRAFAPHLADRGPDGATALHRAARGLRVSMCRWLLAAGGSEACVPSLVAADAAGRTPVHVLCGDGSAKVSPWAACIAAIVAAVAHWGGNDAVAALLSQRDAGGCEAVHRLHSALVRVSDGDSAGGGPSVSQVAAGAALMRAVVLASLGASAHSAPARRYGRGPLQVPLSTSAVLAQRGAEYRLRLAHAAWCVGEAPLRLGVLLPRCMVDAMAAALARAAVERGGGTAGGYDGDAVHVVVGAAQAAAAAAAPFVPAYSGDECTCSGGRGTIAGSRGHAAAGPRRGGDDLRAWVAVPSGCGRRWVAAAAATWRRVAAVRLWWSAHRV